MYILYEYMYFIKKKESEKVREGEISYIYNCR